MNTDTNFDTYSGTPNEQTASRWATLSIATSLMLSFACVLLIAASNLPLASLGMDVVRAVSGQALVVGVCAATSLCNAYAIYKMAQVIGIKI